MFLLEFGKEVDGSGEVSGLGFPKCLFTASSQTLPAVSLGRNFLATMQSPLLLSVFRGARPVLAQVSTVMTAPSWREI